MRGSIPDTAAGTATTEAPTGSHRLPGPVMVGVHDPASASTGPGAAGVGGSLHRRGRGEPHIEEVSVRLVVETNDTNAVFARIEIPVTATILHGRIR